MTWQPIETAPKTGDAVLVIRVGKESEPSYNVVYWDEDHLGSGASHPWICMEGGQSYHKDWPTHWMQLPDPPSADAKSPPPVRCFMDGIDWQHHLDSDSGGTYLFPSVENCREEKGCLKKGGGCGIVEVEVRLIRWVEEQFDDSEPVAHSQKQDDR